MQTTPSKRQNSQQTGKQRHAREMRISRAVISEAFTPCCQLMAHRLHPLSARPLEHLPHRHRTTPPGLVSGCVPCRRWSAPEARILERHTGDVRWRKLPPRLCENVDFTERNAWVLWCNTGALNRPTVLFFFVFEPNATETYISLGKARVILQTPRDQYLYFKGVWALSENCLHKGVSFRPIGGLSVDTAERW